MTTTECTVDRTGWPAGPWDNEPDRVEWVTAAGYPALARRSPIGNWCGYVALPPGHPDHGTDYDDVDVAVHGGLTYGDSCHGSICHTPAPGQPDDVWWLGFDCGHYTDLVPGMIAIMRPYPDAMGGRTYRELVWVRAEVEGLAAQLAARTTHRYTSRDVS